MIFLVMLIDSDFFLWLLFFYGRCFVLLFFMFSFLTVTVSFMCFINKKKKFPSCECFSMFKFKKKKTWWRGDWEKSNLVVSEIKSLQYMIYMICVSTQIPLYKINHSRQYPLLSRLHHIKYRNYIIQSA